METKEKNLDEYTHPEGVEVKVSTARITVLGVLFLIVLLIAGGLLFNYVWGGVSSYSAGYELGQSLRLHVICSEGFAIMVFCFLGYTLLQYGLLYWFSGRDRRALRWNVDWKTLGFLLTKPLALKYYRVVLLTPFVVMGLFPMIHGLCTGNMVFYFIGTFSVVASTADCYYFWKFRSFSGDDKIVDGNESLSATIIKASY